MSGIVDCRVRVAPNSPTACATSLKSELVKLLDAQECLNAVLSSLVETLSGATVAAIRYSVQAQTQVVESLSQRMTLFIIGLEILAEDLAFVELGLYDVLEEAEAWELRVINGIVQSPSSSDLDHDVKRRKFDDLSALVAELRRAEQTAHAEFAEACKDAQMLPTEAGEAADEVQRTLIAARSIGIEAAWATAALPGVTFLSPDTVARRARMREIINRSEPPEDLSRLIDEFKAARAANNSTAVGRWSSRVRELGQRIDFANRVAVAGEASATGRALRAGRTVLRDASIIGGILTAASVVDNTYEQAREDSIDPDLTREEKFARAATHGAVESTGQIGGEFVGGVLGSVAGFSCGPIGVGVGLVHGAEKVGEEGKASGKTLANEVDQSITRFLFGQRREDS